MAKKKLTPYEQAQRQFVQSRIAQSGQPATPELRARYRQRFQNLAQEKAGRTKIAQRVLPEGTAEERKSFKRMLATELPSRNVTTTTTTTTTPTGPSYPRVTSLAQEDKRLQRSRGTMGPAAPKTQTTSGGQGDRGKYTIGQATSGITGAISNRRNNIIGQGINYPGRNVIESITNPFGGKGGVEMSGKGIAKAVGIEAAEALTLVGGSRVAAGGIKGLKTVLGFGLRQVGRLLPKTEQTTTPVTPKGKGGTTTRGSKASTKTKETKVEPVKAAETKPATTTKPKGGTTTRGSKASGKSTTKVVEQTAKAPEPTKAPEVKVEPAKAPEVKVDTKPKGGTRTRGSKAGSQKKNDVSPEVRIVREQLTDPMSPTSQGLGRLAKFMEENPNVEVQMPAASRMTSTPKTTSPSDDAEFLRTFNEALQLVKKKGQGWQEANRLVRTSENLVRWRKLTGK